MEYTNNGIEVLEFEHGVRAYPPSVPGGLWRLRWEEHHKRRDTTAKDRTAAIAKATEIVERLAIGSGAEFGNARGAELVAHLLDPMRRPTRVKEWSERMREEQERYCASTCCRSSAMSVAGSCSAPTSSGSSTRPEPRRLPVSCDVPSPGSSTPA